MIEKPKHTPGPWTVVDGSQGYIDPEIGGDGMLSIEGGTGGSEDWGENERLTLAVVLADVEPIASEAEANARLIAAAPDLLKALRGLLPGDDAGWWCLRCAGEVDATYDERCATCGESLDDPGAPEAIRVARAAIAKATGTHEGN